MIGTIILSGTAQDTVILRRAHSPIADITVSGIIIMNTILSNGVTEQATPIMTTGTNRMPAVGAIGPTPATTVITEVQVVRDTGVRIVMKTGIMAGAAVRKGGTHVLEVLTVEAEAATAIQGTRIRSTEIITETAAAVVEGKCMAVRDIMRADQVGTIPMTGTAVTATNMETPPGSPVGADQGAAMSQAMNIPETVVAGVQKMTMDARRHGVPQTAGRTVTETAAMTVHRKDPAAVVDLEAAATVITKAAAIN